MDDVRSASQYSYLRNQHYIDVPQNGGVSAASKPNALTALESGLSTLRDRKATSQKRAIALAIVLHVVGDIHQPLHCVERDVGGNTFPISGVPDLEPRLRRDGKAVDRDQPPSGDNTPVYQRLHAFWDSAYRYDVETVGGRQRVIKRRSLGRSSRPATDRIRQFAAELSAHYLPSDWQYLAAKNAASWILEGKAISETFAFRTPRGQKPSNAYFQHAHDIACRQITFGGYRLAQLLNAIYAPTRHASVKTAEPGD
jgi:hypothetical protein